MTRFRDALPQLGPDVFLTDSGLETDLLFNQGVDPPQFAAFPLLKRPRGNGSATDVLRNPRGRRGTGQRWVPARSRHLAGQCRLGCAARLRRAGVGRGQQTGR